MKLSLNFEDHNQILGQNLKILRPNFVDLPFFFHSAKTVFVYCNLTKPGAFFDILRLHGDHQCACAQKWCHFHIFQKFLNNKKIKDTIEDDLNSLKGSSFLVRELGFPIHFVDLHVLF